MWGNVIPLLAIGLSQDICGHDRCSRWQHCFQRSQALVELHTLCRGKLQYSLQKSCHTELLNKNRFVHPSALVAMTQLFKCIQDAGKGQPQQLWCLAILSHARAIAQGLPQKEQVKF